MDSSVGSPTAPAAPQEGAREPVVLGIGATLRELLGQFRRYRLQSAILVFALLIDVAYDTFLPLCLKWVIDRAVVPRDLDAFWRILGLLGGAFLVATASAVGRDYLYGWLGAHVLHDLRLRLFQHLQRLSMDFFGRARPGDVVARFSTDLSAVENALVIGLPGAFLAVFGILASCTVMFVLQWQLALLLLVAAPFCFLGPKLLGPRALRHGYRLRQEQAALASLVQENFQAQKVIKAFALRESAVAQFRAQSRRIRDCGVSFGFLCYATERTPNVGMALFNVLVLGVGGYFALRGDLSVGALVSFKALFANVSASVLTLSAFAPTLLQSSGGLSRIRELLETPSRVAEQPDAADLPPLREGVRLERVTFHYAGRQSGVEDVSLEIPVGSRVALVGPSGCGKSTCLSLLIRFFDPDSGRVTFDGRDLRHARLDSLSAQVGVVFQENFLFNTSLRENVRMGRPGASDGEVEAACREAELHDTIRQLPEGYDTAVGEGGGRLSGGQRQRVALARALIRRPALLVLDEATSALDPEGEAAINQTLEKLAGRQTTVTVTHRLQPLAGYDRIFVFEAGRCVEAGAHLELLARDGVYARLWSRQQAVAWSADCTEAVLDPERLAQVAILRDLDAAMRRRTAALFRLEEAGPATVVLRQGDEGDKFYVIARGRVRVDVREPGGETRTVAVLEDGDSFGEIALLEGTPRNATVTTEAPTRFLTLRRAAFRRLLDEHPAVRAAVLRQAGRRHNEALVSAR